FTSLGTQFFTLTDRANTTQSLGANLAKVIGRHSIEVGTDLRLIEGALFQPGWPSGQFSFDPGFTDGPDPNGGFGNGNGLASLLLGTIGNGGGFASYDPHWFWSQKYYAFYLQDDIKVSRKLTVNLGIRYDYEAPLQDRHNQLSFLDFSADSPITVTPVDVGFGLGSRPKLPLKAGARFPGDPGFGRGAALPQRKDWGPRVALAYSITPKT